MSGTKPDRTLFASLRSLAFFSLVIKVPQLGIGRYSEATSKLIRKCFGFFLFLGKVFWHGITSTWFCFSLLVSIPVFNHLQAHWSDHDIIKCPDGYAIQVQPGAYVPCEAVDLYWEAEWQGQRLTALETQSPIQIPNPITKEQLLWER